LISGVDYLDAGELAAEATARTAAQETNAGGGAAAGAGSIGGESSGSDLPEKSELSESDSEDDDSFDVNAPGGGKKKKKQKLSPNSRASQFGMNQAKAASTNKIKDILGSCLYQMSIPDGYHNKTYGRLFKHLSGLGIVPIGLLRGTFAGMSVGPRANRAPYVYTNPDKDTELFHCDKVFVLSTKPVQVDSKIDIKVWHGVDLLLFCVTKNLLWCFYFCYTSFMSLCG
jgi:hypothetical protein